MTFIFKNMTIFWDIPKWNRGQTNWDRSIILWNIFHLSQFPIYIYIYIYEKWYIHNIYIIFLQQIISSRLLQIVIAGVEK